MPQPTYLELEKVALADRINKNIIDNYAADNGYQLVLNLIKSEIDNNTTATLEEHVSNLMGSF